MAKSDGFENFEYYKYNPSMAAAILFIVLFSITGFLHLFQMVKTKTWFFIPFVVGGLFEIAGYVGRAVSASQTPDWTLGAYIVQTLTLLIAPALFAASIYMTLRRIILLVDGEAYSIIRMRWLTQIFVAGDVLSFLAQGAGGGIMAGGKASSVKTGEKIVIGGLIIQLLFFSLFVITAGIFHARILRTPTPASLSRDLPWKRHLLVLYLASFLIVVRSVFRVVEYAQGFNGFLLRHEIFLYLFDSVLMLFVMLMFNWSHPSEVKALLRGGRYTKNFVEMNEIRSQRQPMV